VLGEKYGLPVLVLLNAESIMHIVFQLYDVLRFDSIVVIKVLTYISSPRSNNQIFFRSLECMNILLGQPQHLRLN